MAHERWTNTALKALMVAVFAISSVWFGQTDGRASEETPCDWQTREGCCDPETGQECSPCPTGLAILGARQTGHLWAPSKGTGSPPVGTAVIEIEVAWPGYISHPLNGTPGWSDRSISLSAAGVHEIDVTMPPPGAKDIVDSQQPKAHEYELTFQPTQAMEHCSAADGTVVWPNDNSYTQTTSVTWTPLPTGCYHHLPFELPCYSRTLTLDIAKKVFSGEVTEPAGGTSCSKNSSQDIVVEIQKAKGCGKCFVTVAKVRARGGVFSKKFDLSKRKFKELRKGTFRVWVAHGPESGVSHTCGYAGSAPVKKT